MAETEARLIENKKKQAEAVRQAKSAAATRMEIEQKLTELSTRLAQNQIIAMAKAEERLQAVETAAAMVLHKIRIESSALMAIQERIEQDAIAIERAIAREAVEAMAIEAAQARIRTDEAAITMASRKIREEIEMTQMIQNCFDGEIPLETSTTENQQSNSAPCCTDEDAINPDDRGEEAEIEAATETSITRESGDAAEQKNAEGAPDSPPEIIASSNATASNKTETSPDLSAMAEIV
ncbi:hypothetical protein [Nitrosomonas sp.]|uniref:hypothetical protein n=1 Tax=Nitrosomonas sp. TaxID=42353 RepID=UPI0026364985|nr:hypothetical protein [Nitrosomonas sp.]